MKMNLEKETGGRGRESTQCSNIALELQTLPSLVLETCRTSCTAICWLDSTLRCVLSRWTCTPRECLLRLTIRPGSAVKRTIPITSQIA